MDIRRLGFAGLELRSGEASLVIDLLTDLGPLQRLVGSSHEPLPAPARPGAASLALVTHLHRDRTDPDAIASALVPGGRVLRPAASERPGLEAAALADAEKGLAEHALLQQVVAPWETVHDGPFAVTAVPAADGFGDPQVSWVVEAEGVRILHAGDTLFHGSWWLIAMRCGPIDVAFLPVNGAVADLPHRRPPSPLPVVMDPVQAATAAALLQARVAVPIHYGALHHPPAYAQVSDPASAFAAAAASAGVSAQIVAPGEAVAVPRRTAELSPLTQS